MRPANKTASSEAMDGKKAWKHQRWLIRERFKDQPFDAEEYRLPILETECPMCGRKMRIQPSMHPYYLTCDGGKRVWLCSVICQYGEAPSSRTERDTGRWHTNV